MAYTIKKSVPIPNLWVATCTAQNHSEIRPAEHGGLEVNFDSSNCLKTKIGMKNIELEGNQLLVFNPRVQHTEIYNNSNHQHKGLILSDLYLAEYFGCDLISETLFENPKLTSLPMLLDQARRLHRLSFSAHAPETILQCILDEFIGALVEDTKFCGLRAEREYYPLLVLRIKKRLLNSLEDSNFNLDQLAREVGISKFHLLRIFKKTTGISPMQFLRRLRIEWFCYQLTSEKKSIIDLAFATGFGTLSSFYASFSKAMGVSPRFYADSVFRRPDAFESDTYEYLKMPISR
jgi:AraC-like DNA-binding protein